jgi:hydrogenase maturation factor
MCISSGEIVSGFTSADILAIGFGFVIVKRQVQANDMKVQNYYSKKRERRKQHQ